MKIAALLLVKNEEWIIKSYLSSTKKIADVVFVYDDGSTDETRHILEKEKDVFFVPHEHFESNLINQADKRQALLNEARSQGYTHFIVLDADEIIYIPNINEFKQSILKLEPGQKIFLHWVFLWKNINYYIESNSIYADLFKDFVFYDDGMMSYGQQKISESRTPNNKEGDEIAKFSEVKVIHFQYVPWDYNQIKQAWYMINEFILKPKAAYYINKGYSITKDDNNISIAESPDMWFENVDLPLFYPSPEKSWHLTKIINIFDKFGVKYFESLDIWHNNILKSIFIKKAGRNPIVRTDIITVIKIEIKKKLPKSWLNFLKKLKQYD